jgi:hypothetical protein
MKPTVEIIYTFECDYCGDEWATYNRQPGTAIVCPHCEAINIVEGLQTILGTAIAGVAWVGKPQKQAPLRFDVSELD